MDTEKQARTVDSHGLQLYDRRRLELTGVRKVDTFNGNLVVLMTSMGQLHIKGREMKVNRLDVDCGEICIEGEIFSLIYPSKATAWSSKDSLVKKLFK